MKSQSIRKRPLPVAIWRHISGFWKLKPGTKLLLFEAFVALGWARIRKAMPFSRIAPSLGESMLETSQTADPSQVRTIIQISQAVRLMSRYTLWESKCLVMAMAAMKMLERRRIESTLYLGTGKDEAGKMIAHAWLRSGEFTLTGAEEMHRFTVIAIFGKVIEGYKNARGSKDGQSV
ncbi:lasso peptide biosynthesis B2 protein [Paenibacillus chartarius]|uniref:Lasso peptide biosynthesis B2 protein n=1 Tax=Paenibacillus chartarius TaxID=747481 RepID=A0ABV6DKP4_9BACL